MLAGLPRSCTAKSLLLHPAHRRHGALRHDQDEGSRQCEIWLPPDADLNGDMETSEYTSGLWVELVSADGLHTWPLAWRSKRQGSTASSPPEAETISMATGLKSEGLPMQALFSAHSATQCTSGASRTTRPRSPWLAPATRPRADIYPVRSTSLWVPST